jgi:hypothetical protein
MGGIVSLWLEGSSAVGKSVACFVVETCSDWDWRS